MQMLNFPFTKTTQGKDTSPSLLINYYIMNVGDKAPELLGLNENGEEIRLSNYKGKKIVLYFYPKDSTSGCTAQA